MIGNDIIDLKISKSEKRVADYRFLKKLFTREEEKIIETSANPESCIWRLWSMKEAAYKAHQRKYRLPRKFNPKAFSCSVFSDTEGIVVKKAVIYRIQTDSTPEYLHSITNKVAYFQKIYSGGKSEKDQIIKDLACKFDLNKGRLAFQKDGNGIPWIKIDSPGKYIPVSLSHHGNFTAFIIPLINS